MDYLKFTMTIIQLGLLMGNIDYSHLKASDNVLDNVNIAGLVGLSPRENKLFC